MGYRGISFFRMLEIFQNVYFGFIGKLFSRSGKSIVFVKGVAAAFAKISALFVDNVADAIRESRMGKFSVIIGFYFHVTVTVRAENSFPR